MVCINGILTFNPGVVIGARAGSPNCVTITCSVSSTVYNVPLAMSTSRTTSMIRGAAMRFMLLLLPCWSHWGHIATLEIQERQHRRRLLTIEHIRLFHGGKNLPHGL